MTANAFHVVLCRPDAIALAPRRIVAGASAIPVTGGAEYRVSVPLRRLAASFEERFPALESIEALCCFKGDAAGMSTPGLILLDGHSLIWMALFDETVFVAVDTELLAGNPRQRIRVAREYLDLLRAAGYDVMFDGDGQSLADAAMTFEALNRRFAAAGQSRWFRRLAREAPFGFGFGAVGFASLTAILDFMTTGAWPSLVEVAVRGVFFGSWMAGVQYWLRRRRLNLRLRQIRQDIVTETADDERLSFRRSRLGTVSDVAGILIFGGFAAVSFAYGSPIAGIFLGSFCVLSGLSLLTGARVVILDGESIEGRSLTTRTRIRYEDILRIRQWLAIDATVIGNDRRRLFIPSGGDDSGRLAGVLWERVNATFAVPSPGVSIGAAETTSGIRDTLAAARRIGFGIRDAVWPPLWMVVRGWNHPLRQQFRWHRRLLRKGDLVLGRVLTANPMLFRPPRDEARFDACAIVVFVAAEAGDPATSQKLLELIASRMTNRAPSEWREWFESIVAQSAGFPLMVPMPASLTEGRSVYCATVMVLRRHIPLGHLKAPWLPLLVKPAECRVGIVLPMRLWHRAARTAWTHGWDVADENPHDEAANPVTPNQEGHLPFEKGAADGEAEPVIRMRSTVRRVMFFAGVAVAVPIAVAAAFIWAGPLASGAMFLTRPTSNAPAAHDVPAGYRPKHKGHVDMSTGLYVREDEDLILGHTPPFAFTRTYLSQDHASRQFGVGTNSNAESWLIGDPARFQWAELIQGDGIRVRFERTSWGASYANAMFLHRGTPIEFDNARLGWTGIEWALRSSDGSIAWFRGCSAGANDRCSLIATRDADGHHLEFHRDAAGRLTAIVGPVDRVTFEYDARNQLIVARMDGGVRLDYRYDEGGRLILVQSSDGVRREYTYGARDEMLTIREPGWRIENAYDNELRVVRQVTDLDADSRSGGGAERLTIAFAYTVADGAVAETDITEYDRTHTIYRFNARHRTEVEIYDARGANPAIVSIERDPLGQFATGLTVRCGSGGRRVTRTVAVDGVADEERAKGALIAEACSPGSPAGKPAVR